MKWGVVALGGALVFAALASTDGFLWLTPDDFMLLRLPRLLLALLAGAALSVGGVACQALLRNPLADPYVLGVSGGAALGGVLVSVVAAALPVWVMLLAAFVGAAVASLLVLAAPGKNALSVSTLLLTGVVFNAFAAALITLVKTIISPVKAQEVLFWLMGQLSMYDYQYIVPVFAIVVVAIAALWVDGRRLDVLVQGDEVAQTLGVDVRRVRARIYVALTFLVGGVVALTGLIGFVGLVVPHLVRARSGALHRPLIVASALWGGALLLIADALCRLGFVWFSTELPVGVLTAFIGAPYFIWALRRSGPLALQ